MQDPPLVAICGEEHTVVAASCLHNVCCDKEVPTSASGDSSSVLALLLSAGYSTFSWVPTTL